MENEENIGDMSNVEESLSNEGYCECDYESNTCQNIVDNIMDSLDFNI